MAYSQKIELSLGSQLSGAALSAKFFLQDGTAAGIADDTNGFREVEPGSGDYIWQYSNFADGVSYLVKFYANGVYQQFAEIDAPPTPQPVTPTVSGGAIAVLKASIFTRLGFGDDGTNTGVDVELTDNDINECVKAAIDLINRHTPRRSRSVLTNAVYTVQRYPLNIPGLIDVTDVQFLAQSASAALPDPFDPLLNGVMGVQNYDTEGTAEYLRYNMAYKDAQIIFGQAPEWHVEIEVAGDGTNTTCLYLYLPQGIGYQVGYEYLWGYTPDNDPRTGIVQVHPLMKDWLTNYCTAMAKTIVGRKRVKFGGVTGADGSVSETDGQALIDAGETEIKDLKIEIKERRSALMPTIG